MAAVEDLRHLRQVPVQRGLAARKDDAVERRQVLESPRVVVERHLEVPIHVQVIPVEAGHAPAVAQVRHPEDEIAGQRSPPPEPLAGERELVHRAATVRRPRAIPASSPVKYVAWWT